MKTRRSFLLLLLLALALVGPHATGGGFTAEAASSKERRKGVEMSKETENSLPGLEDDVEMRRALKCNACHVIVEELVDALHAKRAKLHRKLTPDEATTVLERACVTVRSEYGLQMRNNAVTPVYSKHQAVARAEGNWISIFLVNVCAQVVGEHENAIVRGAFDAATSVNDLRARACQRGDAEADDGDEDEDEDGGAGLGVCPEDVDWSRVNTHDDGWSSSSLPTESDDGKEL